METIFTLLRQEYVVICLFVARGFANGQKAKLSGFVGIGCICGYRFEVYWQTRKTMNNRQYSSFSLTSLIGLVIYI